MSTVRNVHIRTLPVPADSAGALLDRLAGPDDPLFPGPAWAPVRFDRPLAAGATGGHGPVRYSVAAYEPGRRIRFAFDPPDNGFHELSVEPLGPRRCLLRHVLEQDQRGTERLAWLLAVRAVHGTVVEELFDNAELALTGTVARPARRGRYTRLIRWLTWDRPAVTGVPEGARLLRAALPVADHEDAFALEWRPGMPADPRAWDVLPGRPSVTEYAGGEGLYGEDGAHLSYRVSILVDGPGRRVTMSSAVRLHDRWGRLHWALVRRGHPVAARLLLRRAHRRLALAAPRAGERHLSHLVSGGVDGGCDPVMLMP
ncbi:DUF2867 domain-containing protein [Streptomyces sp. NPDC018972]|uniref:DUF2867 domain-containing protein n=1 Tax=Streptomyces sp. NPDC018972 TaxID=3365060 RepID=UPI0037A3E400